MISFLNRVRAREQSSQSKNIKTAIIILFIGLSVGLFTKILDETPYNYQPQLFQILDVGNFLGTIIFNMFCGVCISVLSKSPIKAAVNTFLYFCGLLTTYYLYTIYIAGFYPRTYIMIWVAITIVSPLLSVVCWYAKGEHIISIFISSIIIMFISRGVLHIGFWYFNVTSLLELIILILTIIVLYKSQKQIFMATIMGIVLALLTSNLYFINGIM